MYFCAAASETVSFSSFVTSGFTNCSAIIDPPCHQDQPWPDQLLVSFARPSTSRGHSGIASKEVVPFAQLFSGQLEQSDVEAVRSSEGSRAGFR
jgi:hypothetical protein